MQTGIRLHILTDQGERSNGCNKRTDAINNAAQEEA